jgi:hypothetical protein
VCLVVGGNGDFVLERKVQQLPEKGAEASVFRSHLNDDERSALRTILTTAMQLPPWTRPTTALTLSQMEILTLESRPTPGDALKEVGYFSWIGTGSPNGYPNRMPQEVKATWEHSKVVLEPLTRWLASVEGMNLVPVTDDAVPECSV